MNDLARFLPSDRTIGLVGLAMLQIASTIALTSLAVRWPLRLNAASRHAVWRCALIGILIGPWLLVLAVQGRVAPSFLPAAAEKSRSNRGVDLPVDRVEHPRSIEGSSAQASAPRVEPKAPRSSIEVTVSSPKQPIVTLREAAILGAIVWALGSIWLAARLVWGAFLLARVRRSAKPVERLKHEGLIEEMREALGVRTAPVVFEDDLVATPFAAGWSRPVIFLPKSFAAEMNRNILRDVLIHEGAHVINRDLSTGFLLRIAEILYWPNPFLLLLKRAIERDREEVCDNFVLRGGDRHRYARTLVDLATEKSRPPRAIAAVGLFEPRWGLAERINGLLDDRRSLEIRPKFSSIVFAFVGILALTFGISGLRVSAAAPRGDDPAKVGEKQDEETKPVDFGDVSKAEEDELAGTVVDEAGKPIEGVLVDAFDWYPGNEAATDAQGRFRVPLRLLDKKGKIIRDYKFDRSHPIEVRFSKEGFAPRVFLDQDSGVGAWRVVMDADTYFEGRVLDPAGKPVPNALIRADRGPKQNRDQAWSQHLWTETRSGPDGRYRLRLEPDIYKIQVRVPGVGIANLTRPVLAAGIKEPIHDNEEGFPVRGGDLAISADEKQPLDIHLEPGIEFRAKVVDTITGKPVKGFRLANWQFEGMEGTSDEQGILRVKDMFPGRFIFQDVGKSGYARWWSEQAHSQWGRKQIGNQNDPRFPLWQLNDQYIDFVIARDMKEVLIEAEQGAMIRGRVLDPDGKPVERVLVGAFLNNSDHWLFHNVYTDSEGRYETLLPAGNNQTYSLQAYEHWLHLRKWANGVTEPMLTSPGQVIDDFDIHLTRPGIVRGRVVDAGGNPVAGRDVYAIAVDRSESSPSSAKTDADGRFEMKYVRPSEQYIHFSPFFPTRDINLTKKVAVEAGQTIEGVELIAPPLR